MAILFPARVDTYCSDLYLYLRSLRSAYLYLTDQLTVRGLSADLSVIYEYLSSGTNFVGSLLLG